MSNIINNELEETVSESFFDDNSKSDTKEESIFEEKEVEELEERKEQEQKEYKRPAFAFWKVGENTFKLKLKTGGITELEKKYNTSLLALLGSDDGLPKLSVMLDVTHMSMKPWYHNVKLSNIEALYDKYIENGGSQLDFYKGVYMDIYKASGFFTKEIIQKMESNLKKI